MSRCFVGCLGQVRKRRSNRCCCCLRNYPSDVRPTDPLTAASCRIPKSDSSSRSCCVLHFYCRAKLLKKYQPSDRGGSSLVRDVKCLTFLHRISDVEKNIGRQKRSFSTSNFTSHSTFSTFDFISLRFVAAKTGPYSRSKTHNLHYLISSPAYRAGRRKR